MKTMTTLLFLICIAPLYAQIYKWTGSDGGVHFTDEPRPGAEKIELPDVQTFTSPEPEEQQNQQQAEKPEAIKSYVEILSPNNEATIRNNEGVVRVQLGIRPTMQPGQKTQIIFDGNPIGEPTANTIFNLKDINRGAHTIGAQLLDAKGKVLGQSKSITIYMHRPRVGMVPQTRPAARQAP